MLTKPGGDWLKTALDSFHDNLCNLEGYPDEISTLSRVQLVTKTIQLSAPSGVSGTYNARVWISPIVSKDTLVFASAGAGNGCVEVPLATSDRAFGLINAETWTSAGDPNTISPNTANFKSYCDTGKTFNCPGRVVAMGFEVHDTTAEIYRQGSVTCSTLHNPKTSISCFVTDDTSVGSTKYLLTGPVHGVLLPPVSSADALLYPGTTQWESGKGCYSVARVANSRLESSTDVSQTMVLTSNGTEAGIIAASYDSNGTAMSTDISITKAPIPSSIHDFSCPYALFEGLNASASLMVTFRCYFEYFPTYVNVDLVNFATPSPPLDVNALRLYGIVAPRLPLAVEVSKNSVGQFFKDVLKLVSGAVPVLSPFLAAIHPAAPAIAGGIGTIAGMASDMIRVPTQTPRKVSQKKPKRVGYGTTRGAPSSIRK
jgi:hypothetical protein